MRSIIYEQPYEKPVAEGLLTYFQDDKPSGAVEYWRRTVALDGFEFLRVDLDAREADSGHSYLYHAVINPQGRLARLKYRFWGHVAGELVRVLGDVVFDETAVSASREVNGESFEQVLAVPRGYHVWFPAVMGLHFVGQWGGAPSDTAVTLQSNPQAPDFLSLYTTTFTLMPLITDFIDAEIAGKIRPYAPWRLSWQDQWRIIWRSEEDGWPIGMERQGLTAVASRITRYQNE